MDHKRKKELVDGLTSGGYMPHYAEEGTYTNERFQQLYDSVDGDAEVFIYEVRTHLWGGLSQESAEMIWKKIKQFKNGPRVD